MTSKTYSTRSSAVRAARLACKKALNAPHYQAFEGPDYIIHPQGHTYKGPSRFEIRVGSVVAEGFAYDQATGDWTKRITYEARDRAEAANWINFQRDWFKGLRILENPARPQGGR